MSKALIGIVCTAVLTICGCGGGGGGSAGLAGLAGTGTPPPTTTEATASLGSAKVGVDESVPRAAVASITQINTLLDSTSSSSGTLKMPAAVGDTDGFVLALNEANDIVLASVEIAPDGFVNLSAKSTTLALARMGIGAVPSSITVTTLNNAVKKTPSFGALENAITMGLVTGSPASADAAVLQLVTSVISEARGVLVASAKAGGVVKADPREVTDPPGMPFSLLGSTGSLPSVYLTGTSTTGIDVVNATPIYWSASTGSTPEYLDPASLSQILLRAATANPWVGPSTVTLADQGGAAFTLVLKQDVPSQRRSISAFLRELMALSLDKLPGGASEACKNAVVSLLIDSDTLDALAGSPSSDALKKYLTGTALSGKSIETALKTCILGSQGGLGGAAGRFVVAYTKLLSGLNLFQTVSTSVGLAYQMTQIISQWNQEYPIRVCETKRQFLAGFNISNCAVRFEAQDLPIFLAPGAVYAPKLLAYDARGALTGFPAAVKFSPASSIALEIDQANGDLKALTTGTVMVQVADPSLPVTYTYQVDVVDPILAPKSSTLFIGETVTLALVNAAGAKVFTEGSGTTSSSSDKAVADFDVVASYFSNSIIVKAKAAGEVTISAFNPVSGKEAKATIVVKEPPYTGTVNLSGPATTPPPSKTCTSTNGSLSFVGTSKATIDGSSPNLVIDGTETLAYDCIGVLNSATTISIPLTASGDSFTGTYQFSFTCEAPCVAGTSTHTAVLNKVKDATGSTMLTGTLEHTLQNQIQTGHFLGPITLTPNPALTP